MLKARGQEPIANASFWNGLARSRLAVAAPARQFRRGCSEGGDRTGQTRAFAAANSEYDQWAQEFAEKQAGGEAA